MTTTYEWTLFGPADLYYRYLRRHVTKYSSPNIVGELVPHTVIGQANSWLFQSPISTMEYRYILFSHLPRYELHADLASK